MELLEEKTMKIKPISERLFEEFRRIGVSSYRVAQKSGVPQPTFSKYRRDGMQPTRDVLDKICAAYPDIDRKYIEFGESGGATNYDSMNSESVPAVAAEPAQDDSSALNDLLAAQVKSQQQIIDHLVSENKALMKMLQDRLSERSV